MAKPNKIGGHDYNYVEEPLDMFVCKICHLPSQDPHLSICCGHIFCKSCLENAKKAIGNVCPMCRNEGYVTVENKQIHREVMNLHIFCTNKEKGCMWQGEINNISYHLNVCQFETVKCLNACGMEMQRRYLTNHVEVCPEHVIECQYCKLKRIRRIITGSHIMCCPKLLLACPNVSHGCKQKILRKNLKKHRKVCQYEHLQCSNKCNKIMQRQHLADHLQNKCPRRLVCCPNCKTEGEHRFILGNHMTTCDKFPLKCPNNCDIGTVCRCDMDEHRKICPLETIDCEYNKVGCGAKMFRKDLEKHSEDNMKEHLLLTTKKLNDTENELRERVHTLEIAMQQIINSTVVQQKDRISLWPSHLQLSSNLVANTPGEHVTPVIVKMPNYAHNKVQENEWISPPFYAHDKGYKMCLSVFPNGCYEGEGTHMSVYLCIMKGPYDDQLEWPLEGKFELKLLNQISAVGHHTVDDHLLLNAKANICQVKSEDADIGNGWGYPSFICNEDLNVATPICQFLKDDSVFFEVRYVKEHSTVV